MNGKRYISDLRQIIKVCSLLHKNYYFCIMILGAKDVIQYFRGMAAMQFEDNKWFIEDLDVKKY